MVQRRSSWRQLYNWRPTPEELRSQLEGYQTLGFFRSYRKLAAILLVFTTAISAFLIGDFSIILLGAAVYLTLAVFIYRGHKWAFIVAMVVWTMEKAAQLVEGLSQATTGVGGSITVLVWWAFYMSVFWGGFTVERARQRVSAPTQVPIVSSKGPESSAHTAASPTETSPPAQALLGDPPVQPAGPSRHILELIQKLSELHAAGLLSDDEFAKKKAELLERV